VIRYGIKCGASGNNLRNTRALEEQSECISGNYWEISGNTPRTWWDCRSRTGLGPKLCMFITYLWKSMFLIAWIFFHLFIVYVQLICHTISLPWISHELHQKPFKTKSPLFSQFYSIKFHIHITTSFYPNEGVFKGHKHPFIY